VPSNPDTFFDEHIEKGKLATLWLEEFNKKQEEAAKQTETYAKQVKTLQQTEATASKARLAGIGFAVAGYAKLASSVRSLSQAGLEGTAEARRQQIAYQLLGREIAAIYLPATTASTNASIASAHALQNLTEKGQNLLFVVGSATAGLAAFSTVSLLASVSGLKLTGALAGIARYLPLIGLGGGALVGLAAIFLSSNDGAKLLEDTMTSLVDLANALGDAFDEAFHNPGKFWDDFRLGLVKIGEDIGLLEDGAARKQFDQVNIPNSRDRGDLDARRSKEKDKRRQVTPGIPSFGSIDSFERIQLAAARIATGRDIPQQQLDVAREQLEVQKQLLGKPEPTGGPWGVGGDF